MISFLRMVFFFLVVRPLTIFVLGLNIRGLKLLPEHGPAIIIANHNSHLDAIVLMSLFPLRMIPKIRPVAAEDYFLAKKALAWFSTKIIGIIPFRRKLYQNNLKNRKFGKEDAQIFHSEQANIAQGQGASENEKSEANPTQSKTDFSGCFGIDGDRCHPFEAVEEALKRGEIVIFFPEGTRGEAEKLSSMKTGIAHLAQKFPDIPITPVFLHGLGKALPKGDPILVPFMIDVVIGPPLSKCEDKRAFMQEVQQAFDLCASEI